MLSASLLIAWRYLRSAHQEKNISFIALICLMGIAIGSFSLALVTCVMNGFEHATHAKLQGIHSDVIIQYVQELDFKSIARVITTEFPHITASSPSITQQAVLQNPATQEATSILVLKGIDPVLEAQTTSLESALITTVTGQKTLVAALTGPTVLIGKKLAEELTLAVGDPVVLFYTPEDNLTRNKIIFEKQNARIGGIFAIGIDEFDQGVMYAPLPFVQKLFPNAGVTAINIKLANTLHEQQTIERLQERLGLPVQSWKDFYPALVATLKLEKYALFFILSLILLVASMSIISLLFMHIQQKQSDIALLKAMGMSTAHIKTIFFYLGTIIALCGSVLGLVSAAIVGLIIKNYHFITLPDTYYVSHLPIAMSWSIFGTVFAIVMVLALAATWIATRSMSAMNIAQVLRGI